MNRCKNLSMTLISSSSPSFALLLALVSLPSLPMDHSMHLLVYYHLGVLPVVVRPLVVVLDLFPDLPSGPLCHRHLGLCSDRDPFDCLSWDACL